ncbi:MAG: PAS domain S-box protein [Dehalococcoidia bacterium]|nr:PAS domain S-box protein [Dehalococcoidia bacterium]
MSGNERILATDEADAQLRELLAHASLPMWVFDAETLRFLAVNDTALSVYGYTHDEFLALEIPQIRPGVEVEAVRRYVANRPRLEIRAGNWRHQKKSGEVFWVDVHSFPVVYQGRLSYCAIVQSVDERKRLEAALEPLWEQTIDYVDMAGQCALVIDVNDASVAAISAGLEDLGLKVCVAAEAWSALDVLRSCARTLAVVVVDVTIPEGNELYHAIRERYPFVPILLTTEYDQQQTLSWLARSGQTWALRKPFDRKDVMRLTSAALQYDRQAGNVATG